MAASAFDQMMSAANPAFLAVAGESVVYTPGGGSPRTISVMFNEDSYSQHNPGLAELECETITAEVSVRNDTEGVSAPKAGPIFGNAADSLVRNSKTWYVVDLLGDSAHGFQKLLLCSKLLGNPFKIG